MKIKKDALAKDPIATVKKAVDADILEMMKLLKLDGEKNDDDESEVKPCDQKLVDLVSGKVKDYFEKNK